MLLSESDESATEAGSQDKSQAAASSSSIAQKLDPGASDQTADPASRPGPPEPPDRSVEPAEAPACDAIELEVPSGAEADPQVRDDPEPPEAACVEPGSPEPEPSEAAETSKSESSRPETPLSKTGPARTVDADDIGQLNVFGQGEGLIYEDPSEPPPARSITWTDITTSLPAPRARIPVGSLGDLGPALATIRSERIVVLTSWSDEVTHVGAKAIAELLGVEAYLVSFDRLTEAERDLRINHLLACDDIPPDPVAIVIDCKSQHPPALLASVLRAHEVGRVSIRDDLERDGVSLILLSDPRLIANAVERPGDERPLRCDLPLVRPLLSAWAPCDAVRLEAGIVELRAAGRIPDDDEHLYRLLRDAYYDGRLPSLLEDIERAAKAPADLLDERTLLEDTVMYAACHFPDLPLAEFDHVVRALCGDRTMIEVRKTREITQDGSVRVIQEEVERPMASIWSSDADRIMSRCGLDATQGNGAIVRFSEYGMDRRLREHWARRRGVFLRRSLENVRQSALIFDRSERIAAHAIRLQADMAAADPDGDWLAWILDHIEDETNVPVRPARRIAQLLHETRHRDGLADAREIVLKRLLSEGRRDAALGLLKWFLAAEEFRDVHWLQRIIEEGNEATRARAATYLLREMRRAGRGVYEILDRLKEWLSPGDTDPARRSQSERTLLRAFLRFCIETTSASNAEHKRSAETHPLLAAPDEEQAPSRYRTLFEWLFHPGLRAGTHLGTAVTVQIISALLAEWCFILAAGESDGGDRADFEPNPRIEILLKAYADRMSDPALRGFRQEMKAYWIHLGELLLIALQIDDPAFRGRRTEILLRRSMLRFMLKRIGEIQRSNRPSREEVAHEDRR